MVIKGKTSNLNLCKDFKKMVSCLFFPFFCIVEVLGNVNEMRS